MKFLLNLAFVVFAAVPVLAQNDKDKKTKYEFVKTKAVNKTYTVSANDKLKIDWQKILFLKHHMSYTGPVK